MDDNHIFTEDDFDVRVTPSTDLGARGHWDWQVWNRLVGHSHGIGMAATRKDAEDQAIAHRDATIKEWNEDAQKSRS